MTNYVDKQIRAVAEPVLTLWGWTWNRWWNGPADAAVLSGQDRARARARPGVR